MSEPQFSSDLPVRNPDPGKTAIYSPHDTAADLVRVLDGYLSDLQAGRNPSKAQLLADYPDLAGQLEECLAGIEFVHRAAKPNAGVPIQLGDFRIIREVGRGGMGVVYEAEQLSLRRKVALKVLRFGITADAEVMQRFQREAQTVAHLHHTNIVPIHAVGCAEGVHYYAMQFIEGRSLAAVVEESQHEPSPVGETRFRNSAQWALQAAEALAYAHQRGVIHRDVKPSNLILDPEGTVWLTDFGLAKRADEVTMTAAGVVMGTPRYMSPEQAAAAKQPVDHRTDVYSLGATLYELATGRPVFESATPQGVITQILNAEPVAPRSVLGELPRDLETIILKCLAKEPARRYQQARDLADDLRAYLENRPIRARRSSLIERTVRWAKKHRRSTMVSAVSVVASLLVISGGLVGWNIYQESLLGKLVLATDGQSLVADIFNERDELVVPSFPVPTQQPITVPAGSYRVRLSAAGMMSENWQLDVGCGEVSTYPVGVIDRSWAPPLDLQSADTPRLIELDGQQHLFQHSGTGWRLIRGDTMKPAWPKELGKLPEKPEEVNHPQTAIWNIWHDLLSVSGSYNDLGQSPGLTQPAADLNGDKRDDIILASRVSPSLLAFSGVDGSPLWWYRAAPPVPQQHDVAQDPIDLKSSFETAAVVGQPVLVNFNGEPIVVALFVSVNSTVKSQAGKTYTQGRQFYVEAVSVRTGKQIWRTMFDFADLSNTHIGEALKVFPEKPEIVDFDGRPNILLPVNTKLYGFELATGKPLWPAIELGGRPLQTVKFLDADGDRLPEAFVVYPQTNDREEALLKVVSLQSGATLWERTFRPTDRLNGQLSERDGIDLASFGDLDRDGKAEVLLSNTDCWGDYGKHWFGMEVLEGATGNVRWERRLWTGPHPFSSSGGSNGALRLLLGPDLNGDDQREVFVSTVRRDFANDEAAILVHALSGKDGNIVWEHEFAAGVSRSERKIRLLWWQVGDDGWPQLLVPVEKSANQQAVAYVLSASTGRPTGLLPEIVDPHVGDLNSDGIPDLYHVNEFQGTRRLSALKGLPPQDWRLPGQWKLGRDYDGDGVLDYLKFKLNSGVRSRFEAFSGVDRHRMWESDAEVSFNDDTFLKTADVNGDGTSDLVGLEMHWHDGREMHSIVATSGKDGRRLWTSMELGAITGMSSCQGGGTWCNYKYPFLDQCDLDRDGKAEILLAAHLDDSTDLNLCALSSIDGKVQWKVPFTPGSYTGTSHIDRNLWHDLDGDGTLDIVLIGRQSGGEKSSTQKREARAFSGRDGRQLWKFAGQANQTGFLWPRIASDDIDGDGVAEVVVTTYAEGYDSRRGGYDMELSVLRGDTGLPKWKWAWVSSTNDLCAPLLVNLSGDGKRVICLGVQEATPDSSRYSMVMLSHTGDVMNRFPIDFASSLQPWAALDTDRDGREELLYLSQSELRAHRGIDQEVVWKRPTQPFQIRLTEVRNSPAGDRDTLIAWENRTVLGLNPATGNARWRCDIPRLDGYDFQSTIAEMKSPSDPPQIATTGSHTKSTLIQQAWPADAVGGYQVPLGKQVDFGKYVEPVRYRSLPWSRHRVNAGELALAVALLASFCWSACRGQWSWLTIKIVAFGLITVGFGSLMLLMSHSLGSGERYSLQGWYWILLSGSTVTGLLLGAFWVLRFVMQRVSTLVRAAK